jgi:hypothetical protein
MDHALALFGGAIFASALVLQFPSRFSGYRPVPISVAPSDLIGNLQRPFRGDVSPLKRAVADGFSTLISVPAGNLLRKHNRFKDTQLKEERNKHLMPRG